MYYFIIDHCYVHIYTSIPLFCDPIDSDRFRTSFKSIVVSVKKKESVENIGPGVAVGHWQ